MEKGQFLNVILNYSLFTVADPGFPRRVEETPTPECYLAINWQHFFQKLHKNERNWTKRVRASLAPPLDPPMF